MIKPFKYIRSKFYNLVHPAYGTIFMLHRVAENRSSLSMNRDIEITPSFLEQTIHEYKSKGFDFVSLDEVYQIITGKKKIKKKFICFTFDDGYRDNVEVAYPILKKHNCPFAIYITTDFIKGKAVLWWYILEDIVMAHNEVKLTNGSYYITRSIEQKERAFQEIHKKLFNLEPTLLKETFEEWFSSYEFSFEQKAEELSMTKGQTRLMSTEELCTIASHTNTHFRLDNLDKETQKEEIEISKKILEEITGKDILHFAYPFGYYNQDTVSLVKEAGYQTAVITWGGSLRKGQDRYEMKRSILKQP